MKIECNLICQSADLEVVFGGWVAFDAKPSIGEKVMLDEEHRESSRYFRVTEVSHHIETRGKSANCTEIYVTAREEK